MEDQYQLILSALTKLKAKTPTSLAAATRADPRAKAYGIYYAGTEARVTDGYADHGFSFWIYNAIMSHPTIAYAAASHDFGSDESEPKHILFFEVEGAIYFGRYERVQRALSSINEHLLKTARDLFEIVNRTGGADVNSLRQIGGFEALLRPTRENEDLGVHVIRELDEQITPDTIEELANCDGSGMEAMTALIYANNNAARLGLDPEGVRRAKLKYEEKRFGERQSERPLEMKR